MFDFLIGLVLVFFMLRLAERLSRRLSRPVRSAPQRGER